MSPSRSWLRAAAVVAIAAQSTAQQCYYPNGATAPEKPCSSAQGSACCPDKWQCLDNGLCHYPPDNLYGRYSCTDKDWNSPGCPSNLCTYDKTAFGGESITQCSNHDNNWCCNADAVHVDCCQESPAPRPFFALRDGTAYATVGSNEASSVPTLSGITGLASGTGSGSGSSASETGGSSGSRSPSATSATPTPFVSVSASVSSGSAGVATIYNTILVTPTPSTTAGGANSGNNASSGGSSNNIGLIVGCAVGIPLGLALIGIIFWLLRKRRNIKANPYKDPSAVDAESTGSSGFAGGAAAKLSKDQKYRHSRPGTTEIDGNPVGAGRPISTVPGSAELPSGSTFQPGQGAPYGPDGVGIGGGNADRNTWGSVPPQYSPAHGQFPNNAVELDATSAMPAISEKQEYQAYQPPQPAAEMPTVKTPPEDVEKQIAK